MVKSFSSIRNDEISSLASSIRSINGSVVNITKEILQFTNSVTCRSTFGKVNQDQDELINLLREVLDTIGGFVVADLFPSWKLLHKMSGVKSRMLKLHQKVDAALENILNAHIKNIMEHSEPREMENGEFQFPLTNDHIKAVISDMFAAGTETSAATITRTLSEMMRNPNILWPRHKVK
ncbi:PREDICTED: premnaspirodiene oxygenase-like [Nicotiana attenuata]|uniref:premnaspirodiene oxygenase-like n=1 Tax=Nicotiana attenuata TaxID=49451 RepID=UPI000904CE6E|nr:PREDICTED: premnaspirodiene oxygenase-like [Nicotiana attenuata]